MPAQNLRFAPCFSAPRRTSTAGQPTPVVPCPQAQSAVRLLLTPPLVVTALRCAPARLERSLSVDKLFSAWPPCPDSRGLSNITSTFCHTISSLCSVRCEAVAAEAAEVGEERRLRPAWLQPLGCASSASRQRARSCHVCTSAPRWLRGRGAKGERGRRCWLARQRSQHQAMHRCRASAVERLREGKCRESLYRVVDAPLPPWQVLETGRTGLCR